MGRPHDFEMGVDKKHAGRVAYQLGQNVPVKTAEYMVSEAVRILLNWEHDNDNNINMQQSYMIDNIKQRQDK